MSAPRLEVEIAEKDHPHYRCRGYVHVAQPGETVTVHRILGREAVRVELTHCAHGGGACFVFKRPGALKIDAR